MFRKIKLDFFFYTKLFDPSRYNVIYNILILNAIHPSPALVHSRQYIFLSDGDGRKSRLRFCSKLPHAFTYTIFPYPPRQTFLTPVKSYGYRNSEKGLDPQCIYI